MNEIYSAFCETTEQTDPEFHGATYGAYDENGDYFIPEHSLWNDIYT